MKFGINDSEELEAQVFAPFCAYEITIPAPCLSAGGEALRFFFTEGSLDRGSGLFRFD